MMEKAKDHFAGKGTVFSWWNPENPSIDDMAHIYQRELNLIEKIVKGFSNRHYALEISPGKGRLATTIHRLYGTYFGIDISKEMIEATRKRVPEIRIARGDAEELCFRENTFDSAFCLESLVHYPNPKKAIGEMARVMKVGADLILTFDNYFSIPRTVRNIQNSYFLLRNPDYESIGKKIYQPFKKREVLSWMKDAGLEVKEVYSVGVIPTVKLRSMDRKKRWYLIPPDISKKAEPIDELLCRTPIIKELATYYAIHAVKRQAI